MISTQAIIDRLYPRLARRGRVLALLSRSFGSLRANAVYLAIGAILVLVWAALHLYYYNRLVDLEYNLLAAWAQVEVQQQRRYHVQRNVGRLVLGYGKHEREMLSRITELRVGHRATNTPLQQQLTGKAKSAGAFARGRTLDSLDQHELNKVFPQIQLMAEQYPQLRLSENFQQLSKAVVDAETRVALRLEEYNQAVNVYTTLLAQFPANIFGKVLGFHSYDYYVPLRENVQPPTVAKELSGG